MKKKNSQVRPTKSEWFDVSHPVEWLWLQEGAAQSSGPVCHLRSEGGEAASVIVSFCSVFPEVNGPVGTRAR